MPHANHELGLPPGRYGSPRTPPKWVFALLGTFGVLALVPVLFSAVNKAAPETRGTLTSYDIESDNLVRVTVDIDKPEGSQAVCTVQARNFYSDVVGSAEVRLAPEAAGGVVSRTFPTSDKAVVVEVTACTSGGAD